MLEKYIKLTSTMHNLSKTIFKKLLNFYFLVNKKVWPPHPCYRARHKRHLILINATIQSQEALKIFNFKVNCHIVCARGVRKVPKCVKYYLNEHKYNCLIAIILGKYIIDVTNCCREMYLGQ